METTAILTLSCTVKYSAHLKAALLHFHSMLHREIDLAEGPAEDIVALNSNNIARCPQIGWAVIGHSSNTGVSGSHYAEQR